MHILPVILFNAPIEIQLQSQNFVITYPILFIQQINFLIYK